MVSHPVWFCTSKYLENVLLPLSGWYSQGLEAHLPGCNLWPNFTSPDPHFPYYHPGRILRKPSGWYVWAINTVQCICILQNAITCKMIFMLNKLFSWLLRIFTYILTFRVSIREPRWHTEATLGIQTVYIVATGLWNEQQSGFRTGGITNAWGRYSRTSLK